MQQNRNIVILHQEQDKAMRMLPKKFSPIIATTAESFFEKVQQYDAKICLISPSLLDEQPWQWIERLEGMFIVVRTSTQEEWALYSYLQKSYPELLLLEPLLTEEEILRFVTFLLEGKELEVTERGGTPKVRAFLGSGGTGITSFILQAAPWYAAEQADKRILLVDMNEDKRDLTVAMGAQVAQLSLMQSYLVRGNDRFTPFTIQHPTVENISVISAVKAWGSQELTTFIQMARREYDEVWLDVGKPKHVPRLLEEVDEIVYVVRPDALCLGAMKRVLQPTHTEKSRLLITQFDDRFASKDEIQKFLGIEEVMGVIPFEHPRLPLKLDQGHLPVSKKMKKALDNLYWTMETNRTPFWQKWFMEWKQR